MCRPPPKLGMPEVSYTMWHGLYVAKGTPKETVTALNAALRKALATRRAGQADAARHLPFPKTS
jgi:tripartite-type tricarboxylate transporter receptor subunit TctC